MSAFGNTTRNYKLKTCPDCGRRVGIISKYGAFDTRPPFIFLTHSHQQADGTWVHCDNSNQPVHKTSSTNTSAAAH